MAKNERSLTDMGPVGPQGEQIGKTPFVVRASHLLSVIEVLKEDGMSASDVTQGSVSLYDEYRNIPWYRVDGRRRKRTAIDIIGKTPGEEGAYRAASIQFLEDFSKLSPDDKVKIADGQRDQMSHGFANGEYTSRYYNLSQFRMMLDKVVIKVFLQVATSLNLDDKIEIVDETTKFSNRKKPKKVKSLITTAGVARQVILDERFVKGIDERIRP